MAGWTTIDDFPDVVHRVAILIRFLRIKRGSRLIDVAPRVGDDDS